MSKQTIIGNYTPDGSISLKITKLACWGCTIIDIF